LQLNFIHRIHRVLEFFDFASVLDEQGIGYPDDPKTHLVLSAGTHRDMLKIQLALGPGGVFEVDPHLISFGKFFERPHVFASRRSAGFSETPTPPVFTH
jgi:hypothetical protein